MLETRYLLLLLPGPSLKKPGKVDDELEFDQGKDSQGQGPDDDIETVGRSSINQIKKQKTERSSPKEIKRKDTE